MHAITKRAIDPAAGLRPADTRSLNSVEGVDARATLLDDIPKTLYVQRLSTAKGDVIQVQTATGVSVDAFQFNFMQLLKVTENELDALRDGGYWAAEGPHPPSIPKAA
ncbi:hypothetical protein ACW73L_04450 [Methylolobus aquaticus]